MQLIELFIFGVLTAASIHMTWFHSSLPIHLCKILRAIGWHKHDEMFWPTGVDYQTWMRHEWDIWANAHLPLLLAELLTCPVCLSWHISFWVSVVLTITTQSPWWCVSFFVAYPRIIIFLDKK